jgi:hypothetical protein
MAAFPSFDAPASNGNEFKVTRGVEGERDEERERFESSFPDLSGEASAVEVSRSFSEEEFEGEVLIVRLPG